MGAKRKSALTLPAASDKLPAAVEMGRRGGTARAANLTAEELSAIGRQGAKKRWKGHKKKAKA